MAANGSDLESLMALRGESPVKNPLLARLGLLLAAAALAACGASSIPGSIGPAPSAPAGSADASWTTLGSRSLDSRANPPLAQRETATWTTYKPEPLYPNRLIDTEQYIVMDDGARLAATVTWPADADGKRIETPLPAILEMTGYAKDGLLLVPPSTGVGVGGIYPEFARDGYVHVDVDVRGTGRSDGTWMTFGEREQQDYWQIVDWIAHQTWSDGKVGVYGVSLVGLTATLTASKQHPAVKAAYVIAAPLTDAYRDFPILGGQPSLAFLTAWMSLVGVTGVVNDSLERDPQQGISAALQHAQGYLLDYQLPTLLKGAAGDPEIADDGEFWGLRSAVEQSQNMKVPMVIISGLHDLYQRGAPMYYDAIKHHTMVKLIIGPWNHSTVASTATMPEGIGNNHQFALMWFDRYLKGIDNGAERQPRVSQWVWGAERWTFPGDWPNPHARAKRLYLHANGGIDGLAPTTDEGARRLVQQPINGVCSQSTNQILLGLLNSAPLPCFTEDNVANTLELVYETAPMEQDFYFDGPIMADLRVSTTALDAGLSVRVSDVDESGNAFNLSHGTLMLSQRAVDPAKSRYLGGEMIQPWHPFRPETEQRVTPLEVVSAPVEVLPTSAIIRKGHKLRFAIGASNFPLGLPAAPDLAASLAGVLSIYSDAAQASSLVLPVVPVETLNPAAAP